MALTDMVIMPGADYQGACDALRARHGTTGKIKSGDMAQLIEDIPSGGGAELPELTNPGNADTMLYGYQLLDQNGQIVTGEIQSRTADNVIVDGPNVIVNAGHYKAVVRKTVDAATQATPSITVSDSGLITAKATQSAGYVASGTKEATKQLPTKAGTTVTPSTTVQTAVPAGTYVTGDIKVAAVPEDTGVELPELTNPGDAAKLLAGYQLIDGDGAVVDGNIPTVDAATPGLAIQANGDVVAYVDQSAGYTAGGYKTYKQSQDVMPAQTITPGTEDQVIPAYHYLTGKQTIKGDPNLTPENIPEDLTLFGVQGERKLSNVEPPDSLALDPDAVYATTRPKDWLPMPTPGDDEIYVLLHILDGLTGTFSANVTSSGTVTAELGTVVDGNFVAKETLGISGNGAIKKVIDSASYGNLTTDGMKQCMVRIKGPVTIFNGVAAKGPHPGVEVVCGIKLSKIQFGYTATNERSWMNLRYVSFVGNGGAADLSQAFYFCTDLVAIRCEAENIVTNLAHALRDCRALQAVSGNLASSTTPVDCSRFADRCYCVTLPQFAIKASTLYYAFQDSNMIDMDFAIIDTSECTSMNRAFLYGYSIRNIRNLDISSLADATAMFTLLYNLQRLTFAGETTPGGFTISVPALGLTRPALLETINSLPVATAAATLTITGCAGASELTDEDIAIATAKNWTITI